MNSSIKHFIKDKLGHTRVNLQVWLTTLEMEGDRPGDSGDHHGDLGDHPTVGRWPSWDGVRLSCGYLTILGILGDHLGVGGDRPVNCW